MRHGGTDIERRQGAAPPKYSDPFAGKPEPDLGTVNALIDELERQAYDSQIEERLASVIVERRRAIPQLGLTGLFAADEDVDVRVCVPITAEGQVDPRWGRADCVAVAGVVDGEIADWQELRSAGCGASRCDVLARACLASRWPTDVIASVRRRTPDMMGTVADHMKLIDVAGSSSLTFECGDLPADVAVFAAGHEPNGLLGGGRPVPRWRPAIAGRA